MRPNRFLVERNAPEISHDEEGECAAPTGKLMRKAEIDLHIAGGVAAVGTYHVRAAAGCLISRFAFQTGRKGASIRVGLAVVCSRQRHPRRPDDLQTGNTGVAGRGDKCFVGSINRKLTMAALNAGITLPGQRDREIGRAHV